LATLETVAIETPAIAATSPMVTLLVDGLIRRLADLKSLSENDVDNDFNLTGRAAAMPPIPVKILPCLRLLGRGEPEHRPGDRGEE
jgi:hypothetical protein